MQISDLFLDLLHPRERNYSFKNNVLQKKFYDIMILTMLCVYYLRSRVQDQSLLFSQLLFSQSLPSIRMGEIQYLRGSTTAISKLASRSKFYSSNHDINEIPHSSTQKIEKVLFGQKNSQL